MWFSFTAICVFSTTGSQHSHCVGIIIFHFNISKLKLTQIWNNTTIQVFITFLKRFWNSRLEAKEGQPMGTPGDLSRKGPALGSGQLVGQPRLFSWIIRIWLRPVLRLRLCFRDKLFQLMISCNSLQIRVKPFSL